MLNREMMMPGIRMFPINVQVKSYWGDAWFLGAYVNQTISVGNDIKITRFYTHIEVSSAAQGTGTYTVILSTKPVKICEYENPGKVLIQSTANETGSFSGRVDDLIVFTRDIVGKTLKFWAFPL